MASLAFPLPVLGGNGVIRLARAPFPNKMPNQRPEIESPQLPLEADWLLGKWDSLEYNGVISSILLLFMSALFAIQ